MRRELNETFQGYQAVQEDRGRHGPEKRLGSRFQIPELNEDVNMRSDGCRGSRKEVERTRQESQILMVKVVSIDRWGPRGVEPGLKFKLVHER